MNIHGNKLRIAKLKEKIKKGDKYWGYEKFRRLMNQKKMHENIIGILRKKKIPKKKIKRVKKR